MIVFHGSPSKFSKFDYGKIRTNGTMEGVGFYFTDSKRIAEGYAGDSGYLYTVKLNIDRSLSNESKTLSKSQLRTLIEALPNDFLSNYGDVKYEGYETVMNRAISSEYDYAETDTDILGSIYNSCGEDPEVVKLFHSELGYDSIIAKPDWGSEQTIYIALVNETIEIMNIHSKAQSTL